MTTLQKPDRTITADMRETLTVTLEQLILEDNVQDDRLPQGNSSLAEQQIDTPDDKDFTQDVVRQVVEGFKPRKAPGPDGITNEIQQLVYKGIPKTMTAIYNECLRTGCFPTNWKTARILPITKPGREFRPISLINTAGKVLEKLLIKRTMNHLHKTKFLNENQYGFTPQKNTIDAAMEARKFIKPQLEEGRVVIMVSLDVREAFDSAWWPAILKGLRDTKCPRNLYNLTLDYLKERKAAINIKSFNIEKRTTKGGPQRSCCGPGLWNIQYNPILNLRYTKHKNYSLCR
jgi:retron-type reverse transcriptase